MFFNKNFDRLVVFFNNLCSKIYNEFYHIKYLKYQAILTTFMYILTTTSMKRQNQPKQAACDKNTARGHVHTMARPALE